MNDLSSDLSSRWTPSREQDQAAAMALSTAPEVFTAHILTNKHFGWWTPEVGIVHLGGVFTEREAAHDAAFAAAREHFARTGEPVTGGWTMHRLPGPGEPVPTSADGQQWLTRWAVFEDILTIFPKEERP